MKIGKLLLGKLDMKISLFHQTHWLYKYDFEHRARQAFQNSLMKWTSKCHQELCPAGGARASILSWPRFPSGERPLSAAASEGAAAAVWYGPVYICKMTRYHAGTTEQILGVDGVSGAIIPLTGLD